MATSTKTPEGYIDVTVENVAGQTVTVRLEDDERGHDQAETLRRRARREELERVQVAGNPQYRPRPRATADQPVVDDEEPTGAPSANEAPSDERPSGDEPGGQAKEPRRARRERGAGSE